jgi:hypothetical protein
MKFPLHISKRSMLVVMAVTAIFVAQAVATSTEKDRSDSTNHFARPGVSWHVPGKALRTTAY